MTTNPVKERVRFNDELARFPLETVEAFLELLRGNIRVGSLCTIVNGDCHHCPADYLNGLKDQDTCCSHLTTCYRYKLTRLSAVQWCKVKYGITFL